MKRFDLNVIRYNIEIYTPDYIIINPLPIGLFLNNIDWVGVSPPTPYDVALRVEIGKRDTCPYSKKFKKYVENIFKNSYLNFKQILTYATCYYIHFTMGFGFLDI